MLGEVQCDIDGDKDTSQALTAKCAWTVECYAASEQGRLSESWLTTPASTSTVFDATITEPAAFAEVTFNTFNISE